MKKLSLIIACSALTAFSFAQTSVEKVESKETVKVRIEPTKEVVAPSKTVEVLKTPEKISKEKINTSEINQIQKGTKVNMIEKKKATEVKEISKTEVTGK